MNDTINKEYGVYTGLLDEEGINKVNNGSELELYFFIDFLGGLIWRMNHDACDGRFEIDKEMHKTLIEAQYAIEYSVMQSKRFGVDIPDVKKGEHVQRTDSYNKWFSWWNDYIKYVVSDEEYYKLEQILNNNEDHSSYRPEGNWNE